MSTDAITSNITSKQTDKKDITSTATQNKGSATIFAGMTKTQAESAGMLDYFTKIDGIVDGTKDDVISEGELKTSQTLNQKLQVIYQKVDELLKQYGFDNNKIEQIKEVLVKQLTSDDIGKISEFIKDDKSVETLFESFKGALKACKNQNKLDADDIIATTLRIKSAVDNGGWETKDIDKWLTHGKTLGEKIDASVQGAKKNNSRKLPNCLKGGKKYSELNDDEKKEALKFYFSDILGGIIQNAKTDKEKESAIKLQLQEFSKLLIFCSDDERQDLLLAVENLAKDNQIPGLNSLLDSFKSTEEKQLAIRKHWHDVVDGVDAENVQDATRIVTGNADEATVNEIHTVTQQEAQQFLDENKDKLDEIEKKIKENPNCTLTKEEQELWAKRQRYADIAAGKIEGTNENQYINDENKLAILNTMITDVNTLSIGDDVMESVNNYIKENSSNGKSVDTLKSAMENYNNSVGGGSSQSKESSSASLGSSSNGKVETVQNNLSESYVSSPINQDSAMVQQNLNVLKNGTDDEKTKMLNDAADTVSNKNGRAKPYTPKSFKDFMALLNNAFNNNLIQGSNVESVIYERLKAAPQGLVISVFNNANDKFKMFMLQGDSPIVPKKYITITDAKSYSKTIQEEIGFDALANRFKTDDEIEEENKKSYT